MKSLNLPYNPRIDQLRWLAVTLVFLFHFYLEYRGLGGREIATPWAGIVTQGRGKLTVAIDDKPVVDGQQLMQAYHRAMEHRGKAR